ncbi:hypothetical protein HSX11_01905 [Oxalobacteraceae bacterium]|nr:hypothetical protein [Oxalobacteraceae bacterium]
MQIKKVFAQGLFALLAGVSAAGSAQATVIDFESVVLTRDAAPFKYSFLSNEYGLTWGGDWGNRSWIATANVQYFPNAVAHSGKQFAYSNGSSDVKLSGNPFTLNSLWTRTLVGTYDLVATGYLNGIATQSKTFHINTTFQEINLNFVGIDTVWLETSIKTNTIYDDINISAVPEPEQGAMFMAGLAAIAFAAKRKARKTKAEIAG